MANRAYKPPMSAIRRGESKAIMGQGLCIALAIGYVNGVPTYGGGMQFMVSTWNSAGGSARSVWDIARATPREQIYRAWIVWKRVEVATSIASPVGAGGAAGGGDPADPPGGGGGAEVPAPPPPGGFIGCQDRVFDCAQTRVTSTATPSESEKVSVEF